MIIKNLYLKSYGKFQNRKFNFVDNINIFYGKNESGKTTVASAIKTILYPAAKKEYAYKRSYIPLAEKQAYAEMEFENNGETYETTLLLGTTNAKTVSKTVKKILNKEINIGSESVGEHFLKMREDLFDSVCYVRNLNSMDQIAEMDREVCDLLSENAAPDTGMANVLSELDSEIRQYLRKTDSGIIYPLMVKLSETEERMEKILKRKKEAEIISEEINNLETVVSEKNKNGKTEKLNKWFGYLFAALTAVCACLAIVFTNKIFISVGLLCLLPAYFLIKDKNKAEKDTETQIKIATLTERKKNLLENTEDYEPLFAKSKELKNKISQAKECLEVLKKTKEMLILTMESCKEGYIPALNAETEKILSEILDIERLRINDRLELTYTEKGNVFEKNPSVFSKGTKDVVYFALRLAVHNLTCGESPLILDDCFAEMDDGRFEKCMDYLIKKHKGQVFYFTCHKRIFQISLAKDHINEL